MSPYNTLNPPFLNLTNKQLQIVRCVLCEPVFVELLLPCYGPFYSSNEMNRSP